MTTGTKTSPGSLVRQFNVDYPLGLITELGWVESGTRKSRQWSGSDSPSVPRTFETKYYFLPEVVTVKTRSTKSGKFIIKRKTTRKMRKVRVYTDRKRRKHREEHPYTCSAYETTSNLATSDSFELDSSVYPPVGGRLKSYQERDTLTWLGDGAVFTHRWGENEDIALLGKLRDRIAGTDFNMGVFLGEAGKSLDMIANAATTIAGSLKALKRGDLASAARALSVRPTSSNRKSGVRQISADEASARWLELQYGWMPLVQDVYNGAGYLATRLNAPFVQSYRARLMRGSTHIWSNEFTSREATGQTRASLVARISEVSETQLVGLQDPASVVWELVPYSFIADWFIPIGNYLHARALSSALTGTFVTTKVTRTKTSYAGLPPTPSAQPTYYPYSQTFTGIAASTRRTQMERTVSTSLSVPLPTLKRLSDVPSWKRAANSISLLTQAVLRR